MRADIEVGATFPAYEFTDHGSRRRSLSELQGDEPMILVLSRGHFCPKDRRQLRNLVDLYPELKVGYTRIVTISTDNIIQTNEFRDALGAQWPFLTDPGRKIQKDLEIQEYTDSHNDPMIPYTFVLKPGSRSSGSTTATGTRAAHRTTIERRPAAGPARDVPEDPARLGHLESGAQGRVGAGRTRTVPPLSWRGPSEDRLIEYTASRDTDERREHEDRFHT